MANVLDVAQYILERTGELTTWKLQKLVYYSQAWHCVWEDTELFHEPIHAWGNGPVCPDLYQVHKGLFRIGHVLGGNCSHLDEKEKETVNKVIEFYNPFNGQQLSDFIFEEHPWQKARKGLGVTERGANEISLESMVEYYTSL
ncbi:MAG TPA: type II toxin-antitoxin system antitoxin SocA domain-containing protein [Candidatus Babeliaceae bacterium]|nr:type II toxin-antitoxin system antitoxin SocA domain-containing protein [Candidatus Babeliaceae bacterium]